MVNLWVPQEKIIDDLGTEMDSTSNRLDFVQVSLCNKPELYCLFSIFARLIRTSDLKYLTSATMSIENKD